MLVVPVTAMAKEQTKAEENEIEPRVMSMYNETKKDSRGNKYSILGISERVGKTASVSTTFSINVYGDGKYTANGYRKIMTASGKVGMIAGGSGANNTLPKETYDETGAASARVASADSYIYNVSLVTGSHYFKCNGIECSGSSVNN